MWSVRLASVALRSTGYLAINCGRDLDLWRGLVWRGWATADQSAIAHRLMPRHRADASPLGPGGPLSRLFLLVVVVMHMHADVLAILEMRELVMHVDAVLVVAVIVVMMAADANTPRAYSNAK